MGSFPLLFYPLFIALQMLLEPRAIKSWAVVNFSFPCDSSRISRELISCGMRKGIVGSADTISISKWCFVVFNYVCLFTESDSGLLNLIGN